MSVETSNRFSSVDFAPKPAKKRKGKAKPATHADNLKRWATSGVVLTLGLSALLNGYANSLKSPHNTAAWGLGIVVPLIVLIVGKVAGILYHRKQKNLAYAAGVASVWLLLLSVWHCAVSISLLTGSPIFLSLPLAVAVDCGLVLCELAILTA